ncbi:MAG: hypothetical protein U0V74_08285 [Chitinophagales bacterium]
MAKKKKAAKKKTNKTAPKGVKKRSAKKIPSKHKAAISRTANFTDRVVPSADFGKIRLNIEERNSKLLVKVVDITDNVGYPTVDYLEFDDTNSVQIYKDAQSGEVVVTTAKNPTYITSYHSYLLADPSTFVSENGVMKMDAVNMANPNDPVDTYNVPADLVVSIDWDKDSGWIVIGIVHQDDLTMFIV